MRRTSRRLLGLAVGGGLLLGLPAVGQATPDSAASSTAPAPEVVRAASVQHAEAGAVRAPQDPTPPPGPNLDSESAGDKPNSRQVVIGLGGVALIALVLLSRRMRKKPVLFVTWKR